MSLSLSHTQQQKGFGEDLVLTSAFPKRELAASDRDCHSSTLMSMGLVPSARLTATTAAALKAEKVCVTRQCLSWVALFALSFLLRRDVGIEH